MDVRVGLPYFTRESIVDIVRESLRIRRLNDASVIDGSHPSILALGRTYLIKEPCERFGTGAAGQNMLVDRLVKILDQVEDDIDRAYRLFDDPCDVVAA